MFKYIRKHKYKKGFTLIELIVVIAIIAVLVLLAAPKFIGKTNEAKLSQIQNDVRVVENKLAELLVKEPEQFENWDEVEEGEKVLQDFISSEQLFGRGGPVQTLEPGPYREVDEGFIDDINTKLGGDFYANDGGTVYYKHVSSLNSSNDSNSDSEDESTRTVVKEYKNDGQEIVLHGPDEVLDGDLSTSSNNFTKVSWDGDLTHREIAVIGQAERSTTRTYSVDAYFRDESGNNLKPVGETSETIRFSQHTEPETKKLVVPEGAVELYFSFGDSQYYRGRIYDIKVPNTLERPYQANVTSKTHLDSIKLMWDTVDRAFIYHDGEFIQEVLGNTGKVLPNNLDEEQSVDVILMNENGNGLKVTHTTPRNNLAMASPIYGLEIIDNDSTTLTQKDGSIYLGQDMANREIEIIGQARKSTRSPNSVIAHFRDESGNNLKPVGETSATIKFSQYEEPETKRLVVPEGAVELYFSFEGVIGYKGRICDIKVPNTIERPYQANVTSKTHLDSIELIWDTVDRAFIYHDGEFIQEVFGSSGKVLPNNLDEEQSVDVILMNENGNGLKVTHTTPRNNLAMASPVYGLEIIDNDLTTFTQKDGSIYLGQDMANREIEIIGQARKSTRSPNSVIAYFRDKSDNNLKPVGKTSATIKFSQYEEPETKKLVVPEGAVELYFSFEGVIGYKGRIYDIKVSD